MRGGAEMPLLRGLKRREVGTELFFVGAAISPVGAPSFPKRPQAFLVGDGILDDQSLNPFRMRHRQPEPDRPANSHGEPIHDGSQMIEGVGEGLRVRRVAMAEARIVGCDQMVAIGNSIRPANIREEDGNPCSRRMTGASAGSAFRKKICTPSIGIE
jgi:hypothetical protein